MTAGVRAAFRALMPPKPQEQPQDQGPTIASARRDEDERGRATRDTEATVLRVHGARKGRVQKRAARRITASKEMTSDGGCARRTPGVDASKTRALPLRARGETRTKGRATRDTEAAVLCTPGAHAWGGGAKACGAENHCEQ